MTIPMPLAAGADPLAYPLIAQLFTRHGCTDVRAEDFDAFTGRAGRTLLLFLEDPVRYKETLDLAVIVPELARAFPDRFAVGALLPDAARAIQPRYGFRRWPAVVMLADGKYVGAIDGLRNWDEYVTELGRLVEAAPVRPPTTGIAVTGPGAGASSCSS
jgi:hydrogenase-1 operon protein HyaE